MNELTTIELLSDSVEQTVAFGKQFADLLEPGDIIGLSGPLGSGKTQFVRGLAEGLGVDPRQVSSPTFVLMTEYAGRLTLVHMDAYRMEGLSDFESVGWESELFEGAVTAIEWSDRVEDQLPRDQLILIDLEHVSETQRSMEIKPIGSTWQGRMNQLKETVDEICSSRSC